MSSVYKTPTLPTHPPTLSPLHALLPRERTQTMPKDASVSQIQFEGIVENLIFRPIEVIDTPLPPLALVLSVPIGDENGLA